MQLSDILFVNLRIQNTYKYPLILKKKKIKQ